MLGFSFGSLLGSQILPHTPGLCFGAETSWVGGNAERGFFVYCCVCFLFLFLFLFLFVLLLTSMATDPSVETQLRMLELEINTIVQEMKGPPEPLWVEGYRLSNRLFALEASVAALLGQLDSTRQLQQLQLIQDPRSQLHQVKTIQMALWRKVGGPPGVARVEMHRIGNYLQELGEIEAVLRERIVEELG